MNACGAPGQRGNEWNACRTLANAAAGFARLEVRLSERCGSVSNGAFDSSSVLPPLPATLVGLLVRGVVTGGDGDAGCLFATSAGGARGDWNGPDCPPRSGRERVV